MGLDDPAVAIEDWPGPGYALLELRVLGDTIRWWLGSAESYASLLDDIRRGELGPARIAGWEEAAAAA